MTIRKLVPFLVLLIALVGCKLPSLSGGGGGLTGGSKGTATGGSDPKEDIVQASKKFLTLPSYTAHVQGSGSQGDMKSQLEYSQPDRYHLIYQGGTGAGMEMIAIGNSMYMKMGGNWAKSPGDAKSISSSRDAFSEEGLKTLSDVKYEGGDTVDGKSAEVYSYKNKTPMGNYGYSCKMWILSDKGVPGKLVCDYDNGVLKQTTITYDYDSPVKIDPPSV